MSKKSMMLGLAAVCCTVLGFSARADLTTNFVRESETTVLPFGWTSKQYNGVNTPHFKLNGNGAVLNYAWKRNTIQTAYRMPSNEEVTIDVVTYAANNDCNVVLFLASADYSVAMGNSYKNDTNIRIGAFAGDASTVFANYQSSNVGTVPDIDVAEVAAAGELNVAGSLTYHLVLNGTSLTGTVTDSNEVTKEVSFTLPAECTFTTFGLALDTYASQAGVKSVSITGGAPISDSMTFVGESGAAWDVAENWSTGAVPTAQDDVLIDCEKSIVLSTASVAKSVAVTASATFTGAIDGTKIKGVRIEDGTQLTVDVASGVTSEIRNVIGGKIVKTGAGDLRFSNDNSNAINGTTIEITEGCAGPFNGNQDAVMTNPTFIIGADGGLENKGWLVVNGTLTIESDADKTVLSNDFGGNRYMSKIGGGCAIVKKGTGTITLCSGSNANFSTLSVEDGKLLFGANVASVFDGAATAEGGIGVTSSTLQFNGAATLNGGLEIAKDRTVTFNSTSAHVVKGLMGPGQVTMSGSGNLYLAKNETTGYSIGGGVTVNINAATLGFGRSTDIVGSKIGDCTLVFNGGNASAYGWITAAGTIVADVRSANATMDGNYNNHTQDSGKLVKKGTGTLQWNSILDIAVSIEAGLLDKKTNAGFSGGSGVVTLAGENATFAVTAKLADDKVVSGVTGKTVTYNQTTKTYSLEDEILRPSEIEGGSLGQQIAYDFWAEMNGVKGDASINAIAFALNVTIAEGQTVETAAKKKLENLLAKIDFAALADGSETKALEALHAEFANAAFTLVDASIANSTASLFRLKVAFKPAN